MTNHHPNPHDAPFRPDRHPVPLPVRTIDEASLRTLDASAFFKDDGKPRAGIYARSAPWNSPAIERQFEIGERYARSRGYDVVEFWADYSAGAVSARRGEGLRGAMEAAREGRIRMLLVEDVDRLGRNPVALALLLRDLADRGVELHDASRGRRLAFGDQLSRVDARPKTRRWRPRRPTPHREATRSRVRPFHNERPRGGR